MSKITPGATVDPIPAEDLTRQYVQIRAEIRAAIDRVLPSGKYTLGPVLEEFEHQFAAYCGTTSAIGISSGTAALQLALAGLGVGPGCPTAGCAAPKACWITWPLSRLRRPAKGLALQAAPTPDRRTATAGF